MATITMRQDDMTGENLPDDTPTTRLYVEDPRGDLSIEIDLSDLSFKALYKAMDKIVSKGRPILPPTGKSKGKKLGEAGTSEAEKARAWAIAHGWDVKERGRVPVAAMVAYRAYIDNTDEQERALVNDPADATEHNGE